MLKINNTIKYVVLFIVFCLILSLFATILKLIVLSIELLNSSFFIYYLVMFYRVTIWSVIFIVIFKIIIGPSYPEAKLKSAIGVHFLSGFFIAILFCVTDYFVYNYLFTLIPNSNEWAFSDIFRTYYRYYLLIYWTLSGGIIGYRYYSENKKKKEELISTQIKTLKLESQLESAQLQALKMQLNPHFLFNTLNTIKGLMDIDMNEAKDAINLLGELLHTTLKFSNVQKIRFDEELEYNKKFLTIQKIRFKEKLDIKYDIQESVLGISVPMLFLQPFTENAVKHGVEKINGTGRIKIIAKICENKSIFEVHDNGENIEHPEKLLDSDGIGITNTIKRIKEHYKENYDIEFKKSPLGGLQVCIELPLQIQ